MTVNLETNTLYILSGAQGSGKSTFLSNAIDRGEIDSSMVVSMDTVRGMVLGEADFYNFENDTHYKSHYQDYNSQIYALTKTILEHKLKERQTVFLDTTAVSDKVRSGWVDIAKSYGMPSVILIMDTPLEASVGANLSRERALPESIVRDTYSHFNPTSKFPFVSVNPSSSINLVFKWTIKSPVFVIGDTHGNYDEAIELLSNNTLPVLFLGDFVDRGADSIGMLLLVEARLKLGDYAVMGNHEESLLKNIERALLGEVPVGSRAVLNTFSDFLKLPVAKRKSLHEMLKSLPHYYVVEDGLNSYACVHANIPTFNLNMLRSKCIHGSKERVDGMYQKLYETGVNKHTLIRGHLTAEGLHENVIVLEQGSCEGGFIAGVKIDNGLEHVKTPSTLIYKSKRGLKEGLNKLVEGGLATKKRSPCGLFEMYKYSKKVFYDNLWVQDPLLVRARGIVLDFAGNIVQHPFTKVYNYMENGCVVNDDATVVAVEKVNGFMGSVTINPYTKSLLVTTTGSFESDYVGYVNDFLTADVRRGIYRLQEDLTLLFEVVHESDPHIIEYSEEGRGLYLIGARGKGAESVELCEQELDVIAKTLGVKRPAWSLIKFKDLKSLLKDCKHEGFMVRKNSKRQKTLLKLKSPYYLTAKFFARLSDKKVKFMLSNPSAFKRTIDEEYYGLVDYLSETDFSTLTESARLLLVKRYFERVL